MTSPVSLPRRCALAATALAAALAAPGLAGAQTLISYEARDTLTTAESNFTLSLGFGLFPLYDVEIARVTYTMEDTDGRLDTVSGAVTLPIGRDGEVYPVLTYMHGTTQTKFGVPSLEPEGLHAAALLSTQGYVGIAPDYLGMGLDEGFHPYVHARSEALAGIRLLEAVRGGEALAPRVNDQLFLTGYSQGGHASMAMHELLIEEFPGVDITAAAHLSGPYSVSQVMKDSVILADTAFAVPAFLPYVVLGYITAYPDLPSDLGGIFRAPYVPLVERFRDEYAAGTYELGQLNEDMLAAYVATEGDTNFIPGRFLDVDFFQLLRKGEDTPWNRALRDNDVLDFVNPTPTQLLYCLNDEQVNSLNAVAALDSLTARGAANTTARNLSSGFSHGDCARPALSATVAFFRTFQEITSDVAIPMAAGWTYVQADGGLRVYLHEGAGEGYRLQLVDAFGRVASDAVYRSGDFVSTAGMPRGLSVVRVVDEAGRAAVRKVVLR